MLFNGTESRLIYMKKFINFQLGMLNLLETTLTISRKYAQQVVRYKDLMGREVTQKYICDSFVELENIVLYVCICT